MIFPWVLVCLGFAVALPANEMKAGWEQTYRSRRTSAAIQELDDHEAFDADPSWYSAGNKVSVKKRDVEQTGNHGLVASLARQTMLQQLYVEERIRSDGSSGIKQQRVNRDGTRPYYSPHHSGHSIAAIHEHANNIRTVGMGEFIAVMNGVEFRTRHNDYRLKKPHSNSQEYNAVEDIEFPSVPHSVSKLDDVDDQIAEMRQYFIAFRDQNVTHRDYRPYFRPVLVYLEGGWTKSGDAIEESFESDRHSIEASTWMDLQEMIRFTSYTGRKNPDENFAYLPSTIMGVKNGTPEYAQWNYRIMCHPLKRDLPLKHLRLVDDLVPRFMRRYTYDSYSKSRAARFQVIEGNPDKEESDRDGSLLDELMAEVPGKDGYGGNIVDEAFEATAVEIGSDKPLNAAFYHRYFEVMVAGAMGLRVRQRGYSDRSLYVALTNQPKIAGLDFKQCGKGKKKNDCYTIHQRATYAIPLEIIYLTPLSSWNPYNLQYKGDARDPEGQTVTANGRNGNNSPQKAYDGLNSKNYYLTPTSFFTAGSAGSDPADTTRDSVSVLDPSGNVRQVRASGTRILMPNIEGVGVLRQRYPIMPIHGEGSAVWKELEALKDAIMRMKENIYMFRESPYMSPASTKTVSPGEEFAVLETGESRRNSSPHTHEIEIGQEQILALHRKEQITVDTTPSMGHHHRLTIRIAGNRESAVIVSCDGGDNSCWDKHGSSLKVISGRL